MRVLTLDAALGPCSAGLVADGLVVAERRAAARTGQAALLACMAEAVLAEAGQPDLVAVTVGPGSFTGLRAALALAEGIALGAGIPAIAASVAEALEAILSPPPGWSVWTAIDSHRGRVFLDVAGSARALTPEALPRPDGPVALAGDAAATVAAWLAARGATVMLTDARVVTPLGLARAALARHAGALPPRPVLPVYVDPPAASPPAGGLRPAPMSG